MQPTAAQHLIASIQRAMEETIVGQKAVLHQVVTAVIADGHVLLEGAPGLAKTTLVRQLAALLDVPFGRVQCTPDLLPSDVVGTMVLADDQPGQYRLTFAPGPIFASLLLVDEINRTTPRTQSALLEAMQEGNVTVAGVTHPLPRPFIVMATQNPIEMEGTYPLPEAQQDRFLYQVLIPYPTHADLVEIARREARTPTLQVHALCNADTLAEVRTVARQIVVADHLLHYAASVVQATHPDDPHSDAVVREHVRYGASPRAVQALIRTAQVEALRDGRLQVDFADIKAVALPVLRHRIVLRREAQIRQLRSDEIIQQILAHVPSI
jgi:MoxR-like ATPase